MKIDLERLASLWIMIRLSKLTKMASWTVFVGLGFVTINFWDIFWAYVLNPIGFEKSGNLTAYLGLCLVVLGLLALFGDKLIESSSSPLSEQDKKLYQAAREKMDWDEYDLFLNNTHNLWYRKEEARKFRDHLYFLADDENRFRDMKLATASKNYVEKAKTLNSKLGLWFTGPNRVGSDIIEWNMGKIFDGSEKGRRNLERHKELKAMISELDESKKGLVIAANKAGVII